jgi:hypothetical protein
LQVFSTLNSSQSASWAIKLVLLYVAGFVLTQMLGGYIMLHFYGTVDNAKMFELAKKSTTGYLPIQLFQLVHTSLSFLIPALVVQKLAGGNFWPNNHGVVAPKGVFIYIPGLLFSFFPLLQTMYFYNSMIDLSFLGPKIAQMLQQSEKGMAQLMEGMLSSTAPVSVGLNIFLIVIMAAIVEELFFRGTLQPLLTRWLGDADKAILITGIAFSAIHLQIDGFFPRAALGILLGYLFQKSGRLWMPIITHALFNGSQLAGYYMMAANPDLAQESSEPAMLPFSITLFSTLVFIFTYYAFHQFTQKKA